MCVSSYICVCPCVNIHVCVGLGPDRFCDLANPPAIPLMHVGARMRSTERHLYKGIPPMVRRSRKGNHLW